MADVLEATMNRSDFKILVVDDVPTNVLLLKVLLKNEQFQVVTANCGQVCVEQAKAEHPDLILLDVMMGEMSGFEMARRLRSTGNNTPIIFLTARDGHDDQLTGFNCGGDDYITKPFSFDTVLARVKAVLKRTHSQADAPQSADTDEGVLHCGGLTVDTRQQSVTVNGTAVELMRREYMILCLLAGNQDKYLSREEIMVAVWPNDTLVNDRSVDVHIARLRKKLGAEGRRIVNRTGFGYALRRTATGN
jgi:DNA-binding response OmpR family regulator